MQTIQPVILAGGTGSRLWPLSREMYPKQLLKLTGEHSLLQTTLLRVDKLKGMNPPLIIIGEEYVARTREQVDALDISPGTTYLIEPLGKNTAPAVCGAAHFVKSRHCDETILLVLPSDHIIEKTEEFGAAVKRSAELAARGSIVTFGIPPLYPETGYGYIEKGEGERVLSFKEKPELEVARKYLAKKNYYWNSGMLAFAVSTFDEEMVRFAPRMFAWMDRATAGGIQSGDTFRFDFNIMQRCPGDSIDYALMEKTGRAVVVTADLGWSDIGSWEALWKVMEKDERGNCVQGDVLIEESSNCLVHSDNTLTAAIGMDDTIVVKTSDALLVTPRQRSQEVKDIVMRLEGANRRECRVHQSEEMVWGSQTLLDQQPRYTLKRVTVNKGESLASTEEQCCHIHWVVVEGIARVSIGDEVFLLHENQSTYVPAGTVYTLENPGVIPLEMIEIQVGSSPGEK